MGLKITLFGEFAAQANGTPVEFLYKGRNGAILAYLLLRHNAPPKDGEVADLFWADYADPDACLRSWCKRLRDAVADLLEVKTLGGTVHIILKNAEVDVIQFDALMAQGEAGDIAALRQAVGLFRRGTLLQGMEERWAETARDARTPRYLDALQTLTAHAAQSGQHADARRFGAWRVRHLLQLLREKPQHEATWCDLMETLILAGERLEAAEVYRKCQDYFGRWHLPPPPRITELHRQLQLNAATHSIPDTADGEALGGAVPLDSRFYIMRPADAELSAAIARCDSIVSIRGAAQTGKTSLLARGVAQARQSGANVVLTDFRKFGAAELKTLDSCCRALAQTLTDQLELNVAPSDVWDGERSAGDNFERFVRREVLKNLSAPLVWGMDEVDRLFPHEYKDDIFGRFRAWHNERALNPSGQWHKLTLILTYATEAYLLIADLNRSPFNVGTQITLSDLTLSQVRELNERHGSPLRTAADEVERFYGLVGGHPYLVRRGLQEMQAQKMDIAELETDADRETSPYAGHLERLFTFLSLDEDAPHSALTDAVRAVLRGCGAQAFWQEAVRTRRPYAAASTSISCESVCHEHLIVLLLHRRWNGSG
jgi:DNA-binding SARP family transcriptional activator